MKDVLIERLELIDLIYSVYGANYGINYHRLGFHELDHISAMWWSVKQHAKG